MRFIFSKIRFDRFEHTPITYYLGEGGDDHNDGLTWETKKRTFRHVEGLVIAGDIIYLGGKTREIEIYDCCFTGNTEGVGIHIP